MVKVKGKVEMNLANVEVGQQSVFCSCRTQEVQQLVALSRLYEVLRMILA